MMTKATRQYPRKLAELFHVLGQPARLRILLVIGEGEACVCHLQAYLGYRQAYISQHLMELREAGILDARREGRFIFYQLRDPALLQLIQQAAKLVGIPHTELDSLSQGRPLVQCSCPHCTGEPLSSLISVENVT